MDLAAPELSVCVFAWNEVATVAKVVADTLASLERLGITYEVLIVDDGSNDGTAAVADALVASGAPSSRGTVRVLHHAENRGIGPVYRACFAEAKGANLTFFPGDGQFPSSIIESFFPEIATHDLVLGYLPVRENDPVGKTLSSLERILYRVAVGRMPRFQGIFMIRRSALDAVPLRTQGRGWVVVMELILRVDRAGFRVASRPTTFLPRTSGKSKVNNLPNIWANLIELGHLRRLLATRA